DGAEAMVTDSPWQRQAIAAIVGDLYGHQRDLTTAVLASAGEKAGPDAMIEKWSMAHRQVVERTDRLLADIKSAPGLDLSMLAVANRQIRSLTGS
ncbi:MAG: hypothetical protein WCF16_04960, partial [Alphaproteobacteria bacterium]